MADTKRRRNQTRPPADGEQPSPAGKSRADEIRRRRSNSGHAAQSERQTPAPAPTPRRTRRTTDPSSSSSSVSDLTPRSRARLSGQDGTSPRPPVRPVARKAETRYNANTGLPPVMTRGRSAASTGTASGKHTPRRRMDVSLGAPGAQMRLPALPQIRLGWRLLSFVLVGLLGLALYWVWTSSEYIVEAPQIAGLQRIPLADVSSVLNVSGQPVFYLDESDLSQRLSQAFPEFSAVTVTVDLPNTVAVTVTERLPVLAWRQDNRTELVDADGLAFPQRQGELPAGVVIVESTASPPGVIVPELPEDPLLVPTPASQSPELEALLAQAQAKNGISVTTESARPFMTSEMVQAVLTLSRGIPSGTALVYSADHGFRWQDPRGFEVWLGGPEDMQMKLQVVETLAARLAADEIQPAVLSVEWVHTPYYRLER